MRTLSLILVIIGGINWGLVGVMDFNLVEWLLKNEMIINTVYILVGLASIYLLFGLGRKS